MENTEGMLPAKVREDLTPTFIKNAAGVVSCWKRSTADKKVRENYGWAYASEAEIKAENIPEKKRYPITTGLSELGKQTRTDDSTVSKMEQVGALPEEGVKDEPTAYSMTELRNQAKKEGINSFGKTKKELEIELGLK